MYDPEDTIVAVSSPSRGQKVLVRLSGDKVLSVLKQIFAPSITAGKAGIVSGQAVIDSTLKLDAKVYLFLAPHSYTGADLAEIHLYTNPSVTDALMRAILASGEKIRLAGPGEFTARSYFNGKVDLAQAEAVAEIVASSNELQLAAAEKLLAGKLAQTTAKICEAIIELLSLIELGLDFSGEDIELISVDQAVGKLAEISNQLDRLVAGSISYESMIDLPSVGIAGAPNAGKSCLLNRLLGKERSIVSAVRKTTRDVLTGFVNLPNCKCVLFDCAGLIAEPDGILDELAQQAAVANLANARIVVFCVDVAKESWEEDLAIRQLIEPQEMIAVANKSDLLGDDVLAKRIAKLGELFGTDFIAVSAKNSSGLEVLKERIDEKLIGPAGKVREGGYEVALTARHRHVINEAIGNISEAVSELKNGNDEVTAMMMRAAYQELADIGQQNINEEVLETIFSRFCVGK